MRERQVLAFERDWPLAEDEGAKGAAIGATLGISTSRYYQVLSSLVELPAAYAADPLVVQRLRRRRRERAAGQPDPRRADDRRRPVTK